MGEKRAGKKPHKVGTTVPTEGIVTSDQVFSSGKGRFNAGRILFAAGALVLLGVGWGLWSINNSNRLPDPLVISADTDTHYETTDVENIPALLSLDYGMTIKDAANGRFTKKARNYQATQNIAIAADRLGNQRAALEAYALGEKYVVAPFTYGFYKDYMIVAYKSGDKKLGDSLYDKARSYTLGTTDTSSEKAERLKLLSSVKADALGNSAKEDR